MNKYKYNHQCAWFLGSEIKSDLIKYVNPYVKHSILEIGSYEGLSACFFSDNFLWHDETKLTCVDPFDLGDTTTPLLNTTKDNFLYNISVSNNSSKITFKNDYSNNFFKTNRDFYDIVYIDGSHVVDDIWLDMNETDKVLDKGGIMWLDDYMGGDTGVIKNVMDKFYELNRDRYIIIHKGYQLGLRKI